MTAVRADTQPRPAHKRLQMSSPVPTHPARHLAQTGATFFAPAQLAASPSRMQAFAGWLRRGDSPPEGLPCAGKQFLPATRTLRPQAPSGPNKAIDLRAQFALADDYVERRSRAPNTVFEFAVPLWKQSSHDAWDRHGISIGPIRDPLSDLKLVKGHHGLLRRSSCRISECKTPTICSQEKAPRSGETRGWSAQDLRVAADHNRHPSYATQFESAPAQRSGRLPAIRPQPPVQRLGARRVAVAGITRPRRRALHLWACHELDGFTGDGVTLDNSRNFSPGFGRGFCLALRSG